MPHELKLAINEVLELKNKLRDCPVKDAGALLLRLGVALDLLENIWRAVEKKL